MRRFDNHQGSQGFTWDENIHRIVVSLDYNVWSLAYFESDSAFAHTVQLELLNWEWAT